MTAVSLEAADAPGSYLIARDGQLWLGENDGSPDFAADATWWQRPGLADGSLLSFEAYRVPGQYLQQREGALILAAVSAEGDAAAATFAEER